MTDTPALKADKPQARSIEAKRRLLAELLEKKAAQPERHALSFAQERLWFLHQFERESAAYNMLMALRLQGNLNRPALARSLHEIVRRHAALRTTFPSDDAGNPVAVVAPALVLELPIIELDDADEAAIQTFLTAQIDTPFVLAEGPLVRVFLLQTAPEEHILVWVVHHIVFDGFSGAVWQRELAALYAAFANNAPSPLPELALQYHDFAHWQRQQFAGAALQQQVAYWQAQLAEAPVLLTLPTDYPRPALQTARGQIYHSILDPALTPALKHLSQAAGVTFFTLLQSAFAVLLARYSGQHDLVIGTTVANRNRTELEPLIGIFVNTLALRHNLADNPPFRTLLQRVQQTTRQALAHQDLPFEKLVSIVAPERNMSHAPIVQVSIGWEQGAQEAAYHFGDLVATPLMADRTTAKQDLSLFVTEVDGALETNWEYNTDLFTPTTLARMAQHLQTLLQGIVAKPDQPIAQLPLLTAAEWQQSVVEWNNTTVAYPTDKCIHHLFEEQVERTPAAVAVVMEGQGAATRGQRAETRGQRPEDREQRAETREGVYQSPVSGLQSLTYAELNARANQLAHYLQSLGVGPETLVGICVERSIAMVVGLLGILKAGGAYLPLDPNYPAERLAFMLADAAAPIVISQSHLRERLAATPAQCIWLDQDEARLATYPTHNPRGTVQPANVAYVIYTSGSTSQPKGVQIEQRALVALTSAAKRDYALTAQDRVLQFAALSFDVAVEEIFPCLTSGATLVLRTAAMLQSVQTFLAQCQAWGVTVLNLPTAYWHLLTTELVHQQLTLPRALRLLIIGTEAAQANHVRAWWQQVGDYPVLVNAYGPTETTVTATRYWLAKAWIDEPSAGSFLPIGQPIANYEIYILDEALQPVPVGLPGELYIGGAGLARGYLNQPELTAAKFIGNPFRSEPTARLYRTGDWARYRLDQAGMPQVEFLGRIDDQVKLRGFRIELGEIEAVLSQHPAVQQAVVVVHTAANQERRLVAYVVAKTESRGQKPENREQRTETSLQSPVSSLQSQGLRSYLQQKLPDYMIPSAFVLLDVLPLTPSGKLDRRALPAPVETTDATRLVLPRTATETLLAQIWQEVLGIAQVGIHANFFDLGGHSLLAIKVTTRIRQHFQLDTPLRVLFEHQSIAELAEWLAAEELAQAEDDALAGILANVAALSDTEIQQLLAEA